MRNTLKAATLESKFPLLAVEEGCILSKDADITVAFAVELPELYTVTSAEYEAIHAAWCKAIRVLPDFSIVHKQDWFVREEYRPELQKEEMSFLSRSFERHFNERPYLDHTCYLFLTKTTKERSRRQSNWSTLCRGHIVPKEIRDKDAAAKFIEAAEQQKLHCAAGILPIGVEPRGYDPGDIAHQNVSGPEVIQYVGKYTVPYSLIRPVIDQQSRCAADGRRGLGYQLFGQIVEKVACFQDVISP